MDLSFVTRVTAHNVKAPASRQPLTYSTTSLTNSTTFELTSFITACMVTAVPLCVLETSKQNGSGIDEKNDLA